MFEERNGICMRGRMEVRDGGTDWGWEVVVNVVKKSPTALGNLSSALSAKCGSASIVDTLLHCSPGSSKNSSRSRPCPPSSGEKGEMHMVPVQLPLISVLSKIRINVPSDLHPMEARQSILLSVQELATHFPQGFPMLNPVKVLGKRKAQEDLDVTSEQNSSVTSNSESKQKQQPNLVWISVHEAVVPTGDKQRVFYTSSLKALSNQKYRELTQEFSDVGLMTGDVTISPNASCLVMTMEILRGMLYRGSEMLKEVAWVIFDEIHYMKNRERVVIPFSPSSPCLISVDNLVSLPANYSQLRADLEHLSLQMIMERKFQPVIIFSFSRREYEWQAMSMSKLNFNTKNEKDVVKPIYENATLCLNEEDKNLSAIELMLPLLQRGIVVHHSGLLPVIKEVVELLFQEGLVKALFATEISAMGLNMPAKTVVFTSVRKWDSNSHQIIGYGKYIQGATFAEVIEMTDIFEGSIIRLSRRLDEFLN
ncbi:hypothetical protein GIB67_027269 [Kingdonia uniflora]|uniref:Helicase ATP-binding domain-containing protein n=1 Tax=Kingdonia uniflora TaxID=39325 RepID=A0A7J7KYD6_9MAGN|nr:hypothetical protein GIB67_027269 [Kingdonia uniflora]